MAFFLHIIQNSNEEDTGKITEDEETLEGENSLGVKESLREAVPSDMLAEPSSVPTPEQPESASSSAEHQLACAKDEEKLPLDDPKKCPWPSVVEMNTRLRRLVTSYQRNFKKEEMKLAQKAKVWLVQNMYFSVHVTSFGILSVSLLKLLSVIVKF